MSSQAERRAAAARLSRDALTAGSAPAGFLDVPLARPRQGR